MSRVSLTVIDPGDNLLITALNAQLSAWDVASVDVDDNNVRDEGIDARNLVNNAVVPTSSGFRTCEPYEYDGDITDASPPTTNTLMDDGTDPIAIGPIDYDGDAGDMLIVRCSTEVKIGVNVTNAFAGYFMLRYSLDWDGTVAGAGAATWVNLLTTLRVLRINGTEFNLVPAFTSYTVSHLFDTAGVIDSATLRFALWAYVDWVTTAPTLVLSDPSMHATLMRR